MVGHKKATVGHNESAVGREEKNERGERADSGSFLWQRNDRRLEAQANARRATD